MIPASGLGIAIPTPSATTLVPRDKTSRVCNKKNLSMLSIFSARDD